MSPRVELERRAAEVERDRERGARADEVLVELARRLVEHRRIPVDGVGPGASPRKETERRPTSDATSRNGPTGVSSVVVVSVMVGKTCQTAPT